METIRTVPTEVWLSLCFMGFDVITGVVKALKNKCLNSTRAREGMYKKFSFLMFIAFGYVLDFAMNYVDIGVKIPAAASICTLVILTEGISILENIGEINPDMVKMIAPFLSALNGKKDEKE